MPSFVQFSELSNRESYADGIWKAERVFKIAWPDRAQFVTEMIPSESAYGSRAPDQYPWLSVPCWAKSAAVEPLGAVYHAGGGFARYNHAKVTIAYETPKKDKQQNPEEYAIDESMNLSSQIVMMPKGTYKFPDGTILDEGLGKIMGLIEWTIRIPDWATFSVTSTLNKLGQINSSTFRGFAAGRLLFNSCEATRRWTDQGVSSWTVSEKFLYRTKNWNHFVNPSTGNWTVLDPEPYEDTTFDSLLPF